MNNCPKCGRRCMQCRVAQQEIRLLKKIVHELLYSAENARRNLWKENSEIAEKLYEAEEKIEVLTKEQPRDE